MRVLSKVVGCVVAAGLVVSGAIAALPASAAEKPVIYPVSKEYAPKGKKGAIILPWTGNCDSSATIRRVGSSTTIKRSWDAGIVYVRVTPGRYRVTVKKTCDGVSAARSSSVTVRKEKDGNTISRSEFNRIKKGMTLAQVKQVVGTKGIDTGGQRYFDRSGSFSWAEVWFAKGRVAGKNWDAPLGDGGVR